MDLCRRVIRKGLRLKTKEGAASLANLHQELGIPRSISDYLQFK